MLKKVNKLVAATGLSFFATNTTAAQTEQGKYLLSAEIPDANFRRVLLDKYSVGIEALNSLKYNNNLLTNLDVSANTPLTKLYQFECKMVLDCNFNQLTKLNT